MDRIGEHETSTGSSLRSTSPSNQLPLAPARGPADCWTKMALSAAQSRNRKTDNASGKILVTIRRAQTRTVLLHERLARPNPTQQSQGAQVTRSALPLFVCSILQVSGGWEKQNSPFLSEPPAASVAEASAPVVEDTVGKRAAAGAAAGATAGSAAEGERHRQFENLLALLWAVSASLVPTTASPSRAGLDGPRMRPRPP